MIHINKSTEAPKSLINAPVPSCPEEVDRRIYAAADVREQLLADQHSKCAYCENLIEKPYNDVEHYRPKSIYYWLGHEWKNLLYACPSCNRTFKKDQFPLMDESKRKLSEHDISSEDPLIINPAEENPADFITFNKHIAQAVYDNPKGLSTINIFGLNSRREIVNARKELYEQYIYWSKARNIAKALLRKADNEVDVTTAYALLEIAKEAIASLKSPAKPFSGTLSTLK